MTSAELPAVPPVLRFAPSPTGLIHIGNARTALLNALFARRGGGRFVLRFDDTDPERSRREFADATEEDLAWLGIEPDLVVRQSERLPLYAETAERLKAGGRLYPCYETAEELERRRRVQLARGLPPIYDRAALALTDDDRRKIEAEGRRPHWRFKLEAREMTWRDLVRGDSRVDASSLSDPVLIREDGSYLYTLPSVADDAALGITHVIRGEDHVTNTAVQIQLFEALGAPVPAFAHHNLLTAASGEGLSKRTGSLSLRSLRESGLEPMAVASLAVLVGSAEAVRPVETMDELAGLADLGAISRAPAKFDEGELDRLNAGLLHAMPFASAAPGLAALGIGGGEEFWLAVRGNLARFADAALWWRVVSGPVAPAIEDAAFARQSADLLPPAPWGDETWKAWTAAVKDATGRKGKALFLPLRLALTGLDHGPDLASLLPLIGPDRSRARLAGETA
ncbi:glutamate--tRNA ligase [Enterovirga rhinocerotis]|uniref:Glutamate--tRNA ligase n=1 Tax=Enterovirga rhinocerotis TaxID=1339210 RepID=A0A4R7CBM9_9HYPH|nr:glutamate--tRNA ligase [Enterovirga rhinocerotis]TDR94506.1 glutamyl-tRNA synthetase [Enterovirga rhinocerotis]